MISLFGLPLMRDQSPFFGHLYCRSRNNSAATPFTKFKLVTPPSGRLRGAQSGNPFMIIFSCLSPLIPCQRKFLTYGFLELTLGTLTYSPTPSVHKPTKSSLLSSPSPLISRTSLDGCRLKMEYTALKISTGACILRTRYTYHLKGPEASWPLLTRFYRERGRQRTYNRLSKLSLRDS